MEPELPPAVIEYLYVGQGAEDVCARGLKAVVKQVRADLKWRGGAGEPGLKTFSSGQVSYTLTQSRHPAHPALWVNLLDPETRAPGPLFVGCGYGNEAAFRVLMSGQHVPDGEVRRHAPPEPQP